MAIEIRTGTSAGCLHFTEFEAFGVPESQAADGVAFRELPEATPPPRPSKSIPQGMPHTSAAGAGAAKAAEVLTAAKLQAASAASRAAAQSTSGGAGTTNPGAPPPVPAAAPTSRPGRTLPGHEGGSQRASSRASEGGEPSRSARAEEDEPLWLATTGTLTAAVMFAFQFLWVKARWLDVWS
uniref:Uncharacterized protein n=1 Tax=Haptolina brevifila TaxID=156173 RepID=A0A7S2J1Y1_9EUKA|mmetsp:Transcript_74379/g.147810  ORF Transcript_74379/g.147810 Transcript_74379/m.147810 type:complete len:182 (+) Transcript_74379:51-596(+)